MKSCRSCGLELELDCFYKHQKMLDGHLNICKECVKSRVSKHRLENIERIRQYDRDRAKNPERAKAAKEISDAWRKADSRRTACHNAVTRAVRSGKLKRMPCKRCSSEKSLAHHESYDRPLDVMWLCQPCHKQRHKELAILGIEL